MNNKGLGFGFFAVSAFLFAMRYLCAAIYTSGTQGGMSSENFGFIYEYVGPDLTTAAGIAFVAGLVYLGRGEFGDRGG